MRVTGVLVSVKGVRGDSEGACTHSSFELN